MGEVGVVIIHPSPAVFLLHDLDNLGKGDVKFSVDMNFN
jgi:hypothetical protein